MKLKKHKKTQKKQTNLLDPIYIIFGNLYSKHKTNSSNFYIAQINSILFNYLVPNATQIIRVYYREMILSCDSNEYLQYFYPLDEIYPKLKIFGYIYINNFKPPPNYISLDRFNRNTMFKLLISKQELIDRYNYYMLKKRELLKIGDDDKKEYEELNLKNLYDSSDYKKTNNLTSKKSSSRNKPILSTSSKNQKKTKKNVHFSKDYFNLKSYISIIDDESKFESKVVSKYMDPIEIKEDEEIKENSIDSVMSMMNKFIKHKKVDNNNIPQEKSIKYFNKLFDIKNNNNNRHRRNCGRKSKRGLTGNLLMNQNKIINLLKNYRENFGKKNKYYLPLDTFKEKLYEKNKKKELIEKYWIII